MILYRLQLFWKQLLLIRTIRYWVAWIRYIYFVKLRGQLRVYELPSAGVSKNTISHNLQGLVDLGVFRAPILIRPLSVIESLSPDSDILSIGPRTEGELLYLVAHGFNPQKIRGLDLISYSPWIDLGDMHQMPYPDNAFDSVILGWVIAYSDDRPRAAREVIRVSRPGALVAIGVEYNPVSNEDFCRSTAISRVPRNGLRRWLKF